MSHSIKYKKKDGFEKHCWSNDTARSGLLKVHCSPKYLEFDEGSWNSKYVILLEPNFCFQRFVNLARVGMIIVLEINRKYIDLGPPLELSCDSS